MAYRQKGSRSNPTKATYRKPRASSVTAPTKARKRPPKPKTAAEKKLVKRAAAKLAASKPGTPAYKAQQRLDRLNRTKAAPAAKGKRVGKTKGPGLKPSALAKSWKRIIERKSRTSPTRKKAGAHDSAVIQDVRGTEKKHGVTRRRG
jgi:hypothetical protein